MKGSCTAEAREEGKGGSIIVNHTYENWNNTKTNTNQARDWWLACDVCYSNVANFRD